MRSDCSCPVGSGCKHVAAALLEGLARRSAPKFLAKPNISIVSETPGPARPNAPELPARLASCWTACAHEWARKVT